MTPRDLITTHFRLTLPQKSALKKLGLTTIHDLLYHIPVRYDEGGERTITSDAPAGKEVTLYGRFVKLETKKSWKRRVPVTEGIFEDGAGRIKAMWFHQPYIAKMVPVGAPVKVVAKIAGTDAKRYLANPHVERIDVLPDNGETLFHIQHGDNSTTAHPHTTLSSAVDEQSPHLQPVYAESHGITSLWFYHAMKRIFEHGVHETMPDPLPLPLLLKYHLPALKTALVFVHTPKKRSDAEVARKRFAFEEVLCVQLVAQARRKERESIGAIPVPLQATDIATFTSRFPFTLTEAQEKAIFTIVRDMSSTKPMSRLLEGDVGSGKTAVAATIAFAATAARDTRAHHLFAQVAYMAPTEVLAKQLFFNFITYFQHLPLRIGLLTGDTILKFPSKTDPTIPTKVSRTQMLEWIRTGEIHIVVGTHALTQKTVTFSNLLLAIIDEQHRFGTRQRFSMTQKHKLGTRHTSSPHLLSMTATPIPRTLALTVYGDLDLTLLDSMPPGRKPVVTQVISPKERTDVYARIRDALREGRQAYIICPRIDEPDPEKEFALEAKSVLKTAEEMREGPFKDMRVGIMHSKQSTAEKDAVMQKFANHTIDILVATSVVEVGVNVPNATIIMIEGAERFGLAQLHQLRGRVIRSTHQAYCYLVSESTSKATKDRLKAITTAKNGFELAEKDLALRGAGELYGRKQWGVSDIGMEAIKNIKLVEAAREEARTLLKQDPTLSRHQLLAQRTRERESLLHFE